MTHVNALGSPGIWPRESLVFCPGSMAGVDRKTLMHTGLVTASARERAAPRAWICRILSGSDAPRELVLGARPIVVGAGRECDLVLADVQVSRRHAELQGTPEGVRVRDLGSTNGTFWQGSRVTEVIVPAGSTARIGATEVRFAVAEALSVPPSPRRRFGGMVGRSTAMRELFAVLELASPSDATVLLEGESGTGKELAARAIHDHSARAGVPLVVVDCSAITDELFDSQLFGHVRGAFTGAIADRAGAFVEASGGTLFLDELGELSLPSQAKLLRALESQTVQPVGSDRRVSVDTRVVAATHRNLAAMVEEKSFRFDLFYRLAVVHTVIPALRERLEDIPELVEYFYEGRGSHPGPIAGENLRRLETYTWPGNARELRNVLERAWAMSGGPTTPFADLRVALGASLGTAAVAPALVDATLPFKEAKERWVDQFERRYLAEVFAACGRNITHAADRAGINRRHFRTLLRKHGLVDP